MVHPRERRKRQAADPRALREGLTAEQLRALDTLEFFRWTLAFVRRPPFQDRVPVLVDRTGERHAVLRPDGSIDESPDFRLREAER